MARARNIKHSFFTNDELAELEPLARLLFVGMWTIADFRGCLEYRPKKLKAELLPYDECDIEALAINLDKSRFITIYSHQGQRYIKVVNFEKHQNPHPNERKKGSDLPSPDDEGSQVVDLKGVAINRDSVVTKKDSQPTDRADLLIPDSRSLIADTPSADSQNHDSHHEKPLPQNQKFKMFVSWKPNQELWEANAQRAGIKPDHSENLAEFCLYWQGRDDQLNENGWHGKLIYTIKNSYQKTKIVKPGQSGESTSTRNRSLQEDLKDRDWATNKN